MKLKGLYIIACIAAFSLTSCDEDQNIQDIKDNYLTQGQTFERELLFDGHAVDTIISANELASAIVNITEEADWLNVAINDTGSDTTKVASKLRIACTRNNTTSVRSTDVVVTCANKDVLTLKINQGILDGLDDVHDNVTDQPALAPIR